jgi:hemerythrin superfamily protein
MANTQGITSTGKASMQPDDGVSDLMRDHRTVEQLFKDFEESKEGGSGKQAIVAEIIQELRVHMAIEEEIFYPTAREFVEADMVNEAVVEHQGAKDLMDQLEAMEASDEMYDAKVKVLQEQVEHHVEEEEGEFFPECRKSAMDLKGIGDQMAARKEELMGAKADGRRLQ